MLVFELEDCARVILRPSGTEPKAKIYVETMSTAETLPDVVTVQKQMDSVQAVGQCFLHRHGH